MPPVDGQRLLRDAGFAERTGAEEARKTRQEPGRERRKDRKNGGQPGHQSKVWNGIRPGISSADAFFR
jgi:hypothetical protein